MKKYIRFINENNIENNKQKGGMHSRKGKMTIYRVVMCSRKGNMTMTIKNDYIQGGYVHWEVEGVRKKRAGEYGVIFTNPHCLG